MEQREAEAGCALLAWLVCCCCSHASRCTHTHSNQAAQSNDTPHSFGTSERSLCRALETGRRVPSRDFRSRAVERKALSPAAVGCAVPSSPPHLLTDTQLSQYASGPTAAMDVPASSAAALGALAAAQHLQLQAWIHANQAAAAAAAASSTSQRATTPAQQQAAVAALANALRLGGVAAPSLPPPIPIPPPSLDSLCGSLRAASSRWLKAGELASLLTHAAASGYEWSAPASPAAPARRLPLLSANAPCRPPPGSLFLFDKRRTRWRKDQYEWNGGDRHTK